MSSPDHGADAKFYRLLESAPDAITITGSDGRIALVNREAERLFGYPREELIGQPVEILVPARYRRAHAGHRDRYSHNARTRPMGAGTDLYGLRKDGTEFPVEISLSPLETETGRMTISAIRDISARKRAEAERDRLLQERAAHAEASRVKDEFLATLSHELRTPLNAIVGWTSLLLRERALDDRTRHALETVLRNAHAQTQLIEDLIDLSRVVTGTLHIESQPVDLAEVVRAAIDVVRPTADAKRIAIELQDTGTSLLTLGDEDRLRQAIWNLLSNAVKFTAEEGRVAIRLEHADRHIRVQVADTGVGISPDFLPHVFDRFRQGDSSTTRTHGGLGLGLSIVRSIVEAHGGSVSAESPGPGQGAVFTMEVPAPHVPSRHRRQEKPTMPSPDQALDRLDGVRVLVVDDTADERALFSAVLATHGATVDTTATVGEAIVLAAHLKPDVVVSDIAMPGEDGYVLLRKLRSSADPHVRQVPAIAVTAHARPEDQQRALSAGFQLYVSKPVEPEVLVNAVATAAKRPEKTRTPAE